MKCDKAATFANLDPMTGKPVNYLCRRHALFLKARTGMIILPTAEKDKPCEMQVEKK